MENSERINPFTHPNSAVQAATLHSLNTAALLDKFRNMRNG